MEDIAAFAAPSLSHEEPHPLCDDSPGAPPLQGRADAPAEAAALQAADIQRLQRRSRAQLRQRAYSCTPCVAARVRRRRGALWRRLVGSQVRRRRDARHEEQGPLLARIQLLHLR